MIILIDYGAQDLNSSNTNCNSEDVFSLLLSPPGSSITDIDTKKVAHGKANHKNLVKLAYYPIRSSQFLFNYSVLFGFDLHYCVCKVMY